MRHHMPHDQNQYLSSSATGQAVQCRADGSGGAGGGGNGGGQLENGGSIPGGAGRHKSSDPNAMASALRSSHPSSLLHHHHHHHHHHAAAAQAQQQQQHHHHPHAGATGPPAASQLAPVQMIYEPVPAQSFAKRRKSFPSETAKRTADEYFQRIAKLKNLKSKDLCKSKQQCREHIKLANEESAEDYPCKEKRALLFWKPTLPFTRPQHGWNVQECQEFVEWALEKYSSLMPRDDDPSNSSSVAAAAAARVGVVGVGVGVGVERGEEDDMDGHDDDDDDDDGGDHL